ncbi:MAG: histone deacetylase [Verrucomicrobiota bacterium]|nr:histone deacetylase [Verrucomicrobiota bacterium]
MTGLVADPFCKEHTAGLGHPESPARFDAALSGLGKATLLERLTGLDARDAQINELRLCHSAEYLELAQKEIRAGNAQLSTGDTDICARSWDAAVRSSGSVLAAIDTVVDGRVQNAFCVVRPPGHHATADRGMGFCILNNVAVAARYAQRRHGIGKVLIVDWDVHHGNGTQDIFYEDGSVLFFSTHQAPWYPGTGARDETGAGAGIGMTLNSPLPAGAGRMEIFAAFEQLLLPAAENFRPELVLISAGFDSRIGDPLGGFKLSDDDFADLTRFVMEIARRHAEGRVVSVLEGGYKLSGLSAAATTHVAALAGEELVF